MGQVSRLLPTLALDIISTWHVLQGMYNDIWVALPLLEIWAHENVLFYQFYKK